MPPPVDPKVLKQERAALDKVSVKKFGANPRSMPTFGATTVSWDVTVPGGGVDVELTLDNTPVPPIGSQSFSLLQTRTFKLAARTEHTGKSLRSITVTVDSSACQTKVIEAFLVTQVLKSELNARFGGSTKLKLKEPPEVVLSDGTISMAIRSTINVPDWFDADMNITIQLAVLAGAGAIRVASKGLFVNVKWGFFEHLASLLCTGFAQSGMEQIAKEFLAHIVDAELVPGIANALNDQMTKFVKGLQEADPQHREFVMTSVQVSAAGVSIRACPK